MPTKHAAKKALRKSKSNRQKNIVWKEKIKKTTRKIREAIQVKKFDDAKKELVQAYKIFDKAAKSNILKKNTANRKKSRLTNLLNKAQKETAEVKK